MRKPEIFVRIFWFLYPKLCKKNTFDYSTPSKALLMEAAYEELKKKGYNTVENIVKWMQEAKLLEKTKDAETKAVKMFDDVEDKSKVTYEKMQAVIAQMAAENQKVLDDVAKEMATQGPKLFGALEAAAKAFQETINK